MQLAYIELIGYISIPLERNICIENWTPPPPYPTIYWLKKKRCIEKLNFIAEN